MQDFFSSETISSCNTLPFTKLLNFKKNLYCLWLQPVAEFERLQSRDIFWFERMHYKCLRSTSAMLCSFYSGNFAYMSKRSANRTANRLCFYCSSQRKFYVLQYGCTFQLVYHHYQHSLWFAGRFQPSKIL